MARQMIMPLLAGVLGTAFLLGLGTWQMQRLAWKTEILNRIEARISDAPVALPAAPDPVRDLYLPVQVAGDIGGDYIAVLASQKNIGPGYRIVAAMQLVDGRRVLIDRGFIGLEARDSVRPAADVDVVGNVHWPDDMDGWTPEPDLKAGIWFGRDIPAIAAKLGTEPVLIVARSTSEDGSPVTPLPLSTDGIPNNHLMYAITWFSLAAVWLGMTGFLLWRIRQQTV